MTEEIQINRKHIQIFLMSACFELETAEQKSAESQASCSPLSSQGERGGLGEEGRKEPGLFPHLWVVTAGVVQQREADVVQALDLTGVVGEALKRPTADIPWTHQAALNLSWGTKTNNNNQVELQHVIMSPPNLQNQLEWSSSLFFWLYFPQLIHFFQKLKYSQVEAITDSI